MAHGLRYRDEPCGWRSAYRYDFHLPDNTNLLRSANNAFTFTFAYSYTNRDVYCHSNGNIDADGYSLQRGGGGANRWRDVRQRTSANDEVAIRTVALPDHGD